MVVSPPDREGIKKAAPFYRRTVANRRSIPTGAARCSRNWTAPIAHHLHLDRDGAWSAAKAGRRRRPGDRRGGEPDPPLHGRQGVMTPGRHHRNSTGRGQIVPLPGPRGQGANRRTEDLVVRGGSGATRLAEMATLPLRRHGPRWAVCRRQLRGHRLGGERFLLLRQFRRSTFRTPPLSTLPWPYDKLDHLLPSPAFGFVDARQRLTLDKYRQTACPKSLGCVVRAVPRRNTVVGQFAYRLGARRHRGCDRGGRRAGCPVRPEAGRAYGGKSLSFPGSRAMKSIPRFGTGWFLTTILIDANGMAWSVRMAAGLDGAEGLASSGMALMAQ